MNDEHGTSDGLWRWLVGGLAAGGIVLGLLIGAYEIGTHHGSGSAAAPPASTAAATTTAATTTTAPKPATVETVASTPALVARGKTLFSSDACSGCHATTNAAGAGPGLGGLAGSSITLEDGSSGTADDAYLARSITDPDAEIAKGFRAGIMGPAVASFGLDSKPDDVQALVAYIKSLK